MAFQISTGFNSYLNKSSAYGLIVILAFLTPSWATGQDHILDFGLTRVPEIEGSQVMTTQQLRAPGTAREAVERARNAWMKGKASEANKQLSRALNAYPHYALALTIRALMSIEAGKTAEALADLEEAIQADPAYGPSYIILGSVYNQAKRYDDALLVLTRAVQIMPLAWQVHFATAQALFGKGQDQATLQEITNAIQLMSPTERREDRTLVHFWRAHVLIQLRDLAGAEREYNQVIAEDQSSKLAGYARQALNLLPSLAKKP